MHEYTGQNMCRQMPSFAEDWRTWCFCPTLLSHSFHLCPNPKWLASSSRSVLAQLHWAAEQGQAPVSPMPHLYLEVLSSWAWMIALVYEQTEGIIAKHNPNMLSHLVGFCINCVISKSHTHPVSSPARALLPMVCTNLFGSCVSEKNCSSFVEARYDLSTAVYFQIWNFVPFV